MTDENPTSPAPETAAAPTAVETPALSSTPERTATTPAEPVAETPAWETELDKLDAKTLRKNPKIAGIVGAEIQRAIQGERRRIEAEAGQRAAKAAEERLRQLAQDDPVSFAEQWLSDSQKRDLQSQLDGLRGRARQEFAQNVGKAMTTLPEWAELTDADYEALAKAISVPNEDEVIPLFVRHATDLVAERKARARFESWKAKELAKEREALKAELAAEMLRESEAPDLAKPKGQPAKVKLADLPQDEFDAAWARMKQGLPPR